MHFMSRSWRRIICLVFSLLAVFSANLLLAAAVIIPRAPEIAATSYILIDAKTGHIIVEENAD